VRHIIHVTDGAPRNLLDARALGFATREAYALARREELLAALALAGLDTVALYSLKVADQEASLSLPELTCKLLKIFDELRPAVVVTHPYEGGHPDHDATAFAVHCATHLLQQRHGFSPALIELTSYHNDRGRMVSGQFLQRDEYTITTLPLTDAARAFKRRLFACFTTQKRVLSEFGFECERFRPAPSYDFTQPPHPGTLYYEQFDWGMDGQRWRTLASGALAKLGISHTTQPT
jgi:LmbE family N-acetylglucosaminyl deacetylase